MTNKIDFKKKYKTLYVPSTKTPTIVEVPKLNYAYIKGEGDPNTSKDFSDAIAALYALSYTIRMSHKTDFKIDGYYEYVVPPLEGIWDVKEGMEFDFKDKSVLKWSIGIMQPDFVTYEVFQEAKEIAITKKKNESIHKLEFMEHEDGLCCTFMHIGSYDDEKISFDIMEEFVNAKGYKRSEKTHREIYLSDFRKVLPEKLKTVLRFKVEKI